MDVNEQIAKLQEELEELQAERKYTLGQSGVHISALKVVALRERYDNEISELDQKISRLMSSVSVQG